MSLASTIGQLRASALVYWAGRTDQERKFLGAGAAVVVLALAWSVLVAPALDGRAQLRRALPQLRQQAAQLQALTQQAKALAGQPAQPVPPMTREALTASLTARGLTAQSL